MDMDKHKTNPKEEKDLQLNTGLEGVDKAPGEEKGKAEKVTNNDLKGKKVDADPVKESDKPLNI
jgi:hypothetical protein